MRRPNFVILGQGKAGTSLIWRVMRENPNFAFPQRKELHFFNKGIVRPLENYDAYFAELPQDAPVIGEISPSYLSAEAVDLIVEALGRDIKVGFVLRRPIDQAYSRYLQNICAKPEKYSFERYENILELFMERVYEAIAACYEYFGAANVLPMFYERDIQSGAFERRILDHLDLPPADYATSFLRGARINPGVRPHYIHAEDEPVQINAGGKAFDIPPRTLLFCAQPRNSTAIANPDLATVEAAMNIQSAWTTTLSVEKYEEIQARLVIPMARRMERDFGYDMSHWYNAPHALSYDPAPPPPRYAVK